MATRRITAAADTRTLLVKDNSGTFKLTIPADYKVTFGPMFTRESRYGSEPQGTALRVYEAENKQRAVFVGVKSFRDLSLPIERLVVTEEGTSSWSSDDGDETSTRSVKRRVKVVKDEF